MASLLLTGVALVVWRWRSTFEWKAAAMLGIAVALSPATHPWYLLWPVVLLPLQPIRPLFVCSGTLTGSVRAGAKSLALMWRLR